MFVITVEALEKAAITLCHALDYAQDLADNWKKADVDFDVRYDSGVYDAIELMDKALDGVDDLIRQKEMMNGLLDDLRQFLFEDMEVEGSVQ